MTEKLLTKRETGRDNNDPEQNQPIAELAQERLEVLELHHDLMESAFESLSATSRQILYDAFNAKRDNFEAKTRLLDAVDSGENWQLALDEMIGIDARTGERTR